ncbi:aldehyde dehydrogenase family protein [Pseudomonas moraviensis]|uniref:long-chain-fatty-acyl-CoA reductase n=1 Tax=Pseudomonas moraviensis TaxID=321662 RepID=A0A7Y9W0M6_9PSED|nr:aldehyde dehydrogenase family protein [Pseudomonas moraviensis]NYH12084.1 phenylacetate-CoA ligase [Pseudomonas moraviensis]
MYLINGQLHDNCTLDTVLEQLDLDLPQRLATALDTALVLGAVATFATRLHAPDPALPLDAEQRQSLIEFCRPDALRRKLERELGEQPGSLRRIDYRQPRFERWSPLGLVVHITPGNAPLLAFSAVIESLLAGNVNWLRPSSSDQVLTARLLHGLAQCDATGRIAGHVAVIPAGTAQIGQLCQRADGVSAWGGESALRAIRQQLAPGCRWIDWGHRISFIYLTPAAVTPEALDDVVDEVCRLDQQACSSPQWLLVDSDDEDTVRSIGEGLAEAFERRSRHWPALLPSIQEASEITTRTAMARLAQSFGGARGHIWQAPDWRIIWSHDQTLGPSPLFRSLLLKPLPRAQLIDALLPWRNVLQSAGLMCAEHEMAELAQSLIAAGVTRMTPVQAIHDGYEGEPHDGVYALQRLSRRVSVSLPAQALANRATLDPLRTPPCVGSLPIMSKDTFVARPIHPAARLYFRSGGSSGTPALSGYSYRDFDRQMRASADGLFAAGLDPNRDRVMNLFFSGGLYGGFFSFSKMLELLGATHLPMGAPADDDYREIAQLIVDQRVTVLVGMPSTLHRLFLNEQARLREYGGIEKVFLGGEHPGEQSLALMRDCGVSLIRSAIYGSVDAGPLGHACPATGDGVFHLMSDIQHLEIVEFETDRPVTGSETGRLVFTSIEREGQDVQRYDVGDSGRWIPGACDCGLPTPRFELLQRHGRLMRIGTDFICLAQLAEHLQTEFQLTLEHAPNGLERMCFRSPRQPDDVQQRLLDYPTLATLIQTGLLTVEVEVCGSDRFTRNRHSGKTPLLIDNRGVRPCADRQGANHEHTV